ncbi:MAG: hypothetical protein ABIT76_06245 [Chthoniobacterales bacterium]
MKSRGHIAAALILGLTAIHSIAAVVAPGYEPVPSVTPHDEVIIRPVLDTTSPGPALVVMPRLTPAPVSYPVTSNPGSNHLRTVVVWTFIAAGVAGIAILLWRQHQQQKTQRRWRKRHSKWRIF